MGTISAPRPVKLFAGVLSADPALFPAVEERLCSLFGKVELRTEPFPFDSTAYYDEEMGRPLKRVFYGFCELIVAETISRIKVQTNRIEAEFASRSSGARRPVNIDPGYLEEAKLVLASTKNFSHRILISGGIYAEVTMRFENREWRALPWTFPDFRTGRYNDFFTALRNNYRRQLKDPGAIPVSNS